MNTLFLLFLVLLNGLCAFVNFETKSYRLAMFNAFVAGWVAALGLVSLDR